jgi:hypothetical protein
LPAAALAAAAAAAAAVRVCTCPQRHPWWGGRAHQGEGVTSDQQAHGWTRHTSSMQQQQQQHMALLLQPLHMPPAPPSSSLNRARTVQCDQGVIAVLTCLQPGASIVFNCCFLLLSPTLPPPSHPQDMSSLWRLARIHNMIPSILLCFVGAWVSRADSQGDKQDQQRTAGSLHLPLLWLCRPPWQWGAEMPCRQL